REAQSLYEDFRLESVAARLNLQALEDLRFVNLQTIVVLQPPSRNQIHDQCEGLRDERARPGSGPPHVPREPDDDVGVAHMAEQLPKGGIAPCVVPVDHHDVAQGSRVDPPPIRPAEAHVAFILKEPDGGEAIQVRAYDRRRLTAGASIDD